MIGNMDNFDLVNFDVIDWFIYSGIGILALIFIALVLESIYGKGKDN